MCGRYSLAGPNLAQVRAAYPVAEDVEVRRRYNVAPGDRVVAVTASREGVARGELLRWGLVPSWATRPEMGLKMINARAETVAEKPAYRGALQRMRCLILADGFYEWQRREGAPKQAFHITAEGRELFAFAGLWSVWHGPDDEVIRSCTIITTTANSRVAPLHDRMPVILRREDEPAWIDPARGPGEALSLLSGLPAEQTLVRAVGSAVNDARYDGPECLADATLAQPSLF